MGGKGRTGGEGESVRTANNRDDERGGREREQYGVTHIGANLFVLTASKSGVGETFETVAWPCDTRMALLLSLPLFDPLSKINCFSGV